MVREFLILFRIFNEFPKNALQNYVDLGHAIFTNEKPSKSQINADLKKQQFMPKLKSHSHSYVSTYVDNFLK